MSTPRRSSRCFSLFPAAPPANTLSKFPSGFYQPKNYQDAVRCSTLDKFIRHGAHPIQDGSLAIVPVGTDKRGLSASLQPCEASRLSAAASGGSSRRWDPLWEVEIDVGVLRDASRAPGCHASGSPHEVFEFVKEKEKEKDGDCGDVQDSMNVDDLSELLTHIEAQEEDQGVDFSIFIEDEDALNVEEISDMFCALEDGVGDLLSMFSSSSDALAGENDDEDAQNVDAGSELFTSLEQTDAKELPVSEDVCDAANVDEVSALFSSLEDYSSADEELTEAIQVEADQEDATNVDQVADLFSALEETTTTAYSGEAQADWIDSLEVDNFSSLFSEMEQKQTVCQLMPRAVPVASSAVKVDPRIFVPKFSVRIEGSAPAAGRDFAKQFGHPNSSSSSHLLAGPPVFLAGPPQLFASSSLSREDRVERWKEKRKVRSFMAREPDAVVSDTRRACAAKRQRVKGRFMSEKCAFVSITALQK